MHNIYIIKINLCSVHIKTHKYILYIIMGNCLNTITLYQHFKPIYFVLTQQLD